jgi:hypothetical protein
MNWIIKLSNYHQCKNADQASELAVQAQDAASEGYEKMNGMITAMAEIFHTSKSNLGFITPIDDIAAQANLWALNAAIEGGTRPRFCSCCRWTAKPCCSKQHSDHKNDKVNCRLSF